MEEILSHAELRSLARSGNNVLPVAVRLPSGDRDAFATFRAARAKFPGASFFEGVDPSGRRSRHSWIGIGSLKRWIVQDGRLNARKTRNPLEALERELGRLKSPRLPELPDFYAGATGYLGYECVRYLEPKLGSARGQHPIPHPEAYFELHETWIIFDHAKQRISVVSAAYLPLGPMARELRRARRANSRAVAALARASVRSRKPVAARRGAAVDGNSRMRAAFSESVRALQNHIRAGDIFQCVLSHPFWARSRRAPLELYAELRQKNPSPYMFYLDLPEGVAVFGASPERLVKVTDGVAETHPIAGTRPRGKSAREDARHESALLRSPKERAEHMMLVDLGRNDLGRVCVPGSVGVSGFMRVERFSHVMHIVSTVRGRLRARVSGLQALYACFPAGTLSGAPKFRAMELIQANEEGPRGIYGGAIVQLGFNGHLDSCITIRSAIAHRGRVCIQAGAGIVYDSRAASEYAETLHKSRVLREVCR